MIPKEYTAWHGSEHGWYGQVGVGWRGCARVLGRLDLAGDVDEDALLGRSVNPEAFILGLIAKSPGIGTSQIVDAVTIRRQEALEILARLRAQRKVRVVKVRKAFFYYPIEEGK